MTEPAAIRKSFEPLPAEPARLHQFIIMVLSDAADRG